MYVVHVLKQVLLSILHACFEKACSDGKFLSSFEDYFDLYLTNSFVVKLLSQMVASEDPPSSKVPLLAKFAKPRAPLINSVSPSSANVDCHLLFSRN